MPRTLIFDLAQYDLTRVLYDREGIRQINPHRFEFEMLDIVIHCDNKRMIAYKDVRDDEFWIRGHIPGRPLMPGVFMIEAAAQAASIYARTQLKWPGFIGFGGLENFKFRQAVVPGQRLLIILEHRWDRHRRVCCATQGLVNDTLVFEGEIIGNQMG
jgi:3-hydroxyacyl-[acyl-carrier-protein] dehydratase